MKDLNEASTVQCAILQELHIDIGVGTRILYTFGEMMNSRANTAENDAPVGGGNVEEDLMDVFREESIDGRGR